MVELFGLPVTPIGPPHDPSEDTAPEEPTNLTGSGADPTHHIVLSDGERQVGFVITDPSGDRDESSYKRYPKSTPEQPYVTEKQSSFGGGFGQVAFEENRSMYWRSKGVDTTKAALVLAPAFHYSKGTFRKAQEYMPDGTFHERILIGNRAWVAMPFTPLQQWTSTTYLKLFLGKEGDVPSLRIRLYTNSGGEPNTLIHTENITASDITDPDMQWVRFAIADTYTYASGTQYWVVLTTTGSGKGFWKIGESTSTSNGLRSTDGSTWVSALSFYFRIEGPAAPFTARFFDYKKQAYTLFMYDDSSASTLWMNGWRGACDANTGTLTKLKDSTQTEWATKISGAEIAQIVAGPASGELEDQRTVKSGINGVITVDNAWIHTQSTSDDYVVTNSDWWFAVTHASLLDGKVTDVAVADGVTYICRGNNRRVTIFRHHNVNGTWTKEFDSRDAKAQFARTVNDPISGDILWYGYNVRSEGMYKPYVWQAAPIPFESASKGVTILSWMDAAADKWQASTGDITITPTTGGSAIKVTVGEVDIVTVTDGGTGYAVDEVLTLDDTGSSGTATVTVTGHTGGVIDSVSITTKGFDYSTGLKGTTGGGNGDATITINAPLGGFSTGQIAYVNLKDADGVAETYDLRYMTRLELMLDWKMVTPSVEVLAAGVIEVQLDNTQGSSSPFAELTVPEIEQRDKRIKSITLSLETTDGAQELTSMGLKLTTAQDYSFTLYIRGNWYVYSDKKPIVVGQVDGDNITGLESYGDPETAWVFTEAGFGQLKNHKFLPVPNREIKTARNSNNGVGHDVHDVYLLFTWQGRLQQYYRQKIDDLGPDFPAGMGDIAGKIVDVQTYPGRIYVAVDGGENNKSMILVRDGGAWHEVYTSFSGERIRSLFVQSIEGKPDKLWASVGSDLMWFPIVLDATQLPDNTDYTFAPVGYLDTSWIYTASRDLDKVFRSVLVTMDKANDSDLQVDVYFKVDDDSNDWEEAFGFQRSPSTLEVVFTKGVADAVIRGNRLRIRLALSTRVTTKTPVVRSIQNRMYRMNETKFSYVWLCSLSTISINLRGDEERVIGSFATSQAAYDVLDSWASHLMPLSVESDIATIANKLVVLQGVPAQLMMIVHDEKIQNQTLQITVDEL